MPAYTVGIEEEFFVSHAGTFAPAKRVPKDLIRQFLKMKPGCVSTEMLQTQIEVNTGICASLAQAAEELAKLREMLQRTARDHGYVISASGTHPMAVWYEQVLTQKARYRRIEEDLQIVGRRNVLCGLHVHVEVPDAEQRVAIMRRSLPYLPLLLALSLSSPFWQGHPTGLKGYRLSAYDELPRTGFPPLFASVAAYNDYVAALVSAGIIPNASHLWWCIRPAVSFPTIELRIADSTPRLADVLCVAAWFRCLIRRLHEDSRFGYPVTAERLAVISENRWRIQRFGTAATVVEPGSLQTTSVAGEMERLATVLGEDADALGCRAEFDAWRAILHAGTAADCQLQIYDRARAAGLSRTSALREVMAWLADETASAAPYEPASTATG